MTSKTNINGQTANGALKICQNDFCSINNLSNRIFWKKEIDHQYRFYLSTLRAERDARYLIDEHTLLLKRIEKEEDTNIQLRKEIRLLQTELYVMYQRNAHDSAVIDGLQEAENEAMKEVRHMDFQILHQIKNIKMDDDHEDGLNDMIKEEIRLLQRKDAEDMKLIPLFKPVEKQLEDALAEEKLKNHQQAMKFQREFEDMLGEYQKQNSNLEDVIAERSSAIEWVAETFSSIIPSRTAAGQSTIPESDQSSVASSQETDHFEVSVQEELPDIDDQSEKIQVMKNEYAKNIAMKELLDAKNLVNMRVINDCLYSFAENIKTWAEEYLSVYQVSAEIGFIEEYLQRLNAMRQKKDFLNDENTAEDAELLDQLNLIFNSLVTEKAYLLNMLQYFTWTFPEDFATLCVVLAKTEELFTNPVELQSPG